LPKCCATNSFWGSYITSEPKAFLDAIDETNLIVRLDHQGFRQTCELAATLSQNPATMNLFVSAYFSAMTIAQSGFTDTVLRTIADTGASGTSLCIELTGPRLRATLAKPTRP
jgi:EAL domain-containing protein (putative c-di-GMP-specific phosphodiesterase class I)